MCKILCTLSILCMMLCISCGLTNNCIEIGGSYDPQNGSGEIGGNLKWCFDSAKTQEAGNPILTSGNETATLITEKQAEQINAAFMGVEAKDAVAAKEVPSDIENIKKLLQRIRND